MSLGVAGKEILTLSDLYLSCQFLPLSDRTNKMDLYDYWSFNTLEQSRFIITKTIGCSSRRFKYDKTLLLVHYSQNTESIPILTITMRIISRTQ